MEYGIALYAIELNHCLNGVYTNDGLKGEICNEIAKRRGTVAPGYVDDPEEINGIYDCIYFGNKNTREGYELLIGSNPKNKIREYEFIWRNKKGQEEFKGIGYKMNDKQVAVQYKYVGK
jgi:hypothetical protein